VNPPLETVACSKKIVHFGYEIHFNIIVNRPPKMMHEKHRQRTEKILRKR
jgi:hypothetical protein